jgi:aryl-alcohol dehydrogenase-like predicted oxidoreductase
MNYRLLGNTGVTVSSLCYGTMSFGGDADEATATALYGRCRDAGINFFDCANTYGYGRAETVLGRCMAGHREELVLTSKVGFRMREGINGEGLSRRHILGELEQSLRRLGTDHLDLYFCHRLDPHTPAEETLAALDTLVQQGKILYPAVSNWAAWQIARALGLSALHGWVRFAVLQPMYNLTKRQAEVELLPLAQAEQLGVIPYSPLGGGLLTGKYSGDRRAQSGRLVENSMYKSRHGEPTHHAVAARFNDYARSRGYAPATLAVAWVMSHPAVTAPIIGARSLEQLEPSLAAAEISMTPEWRAEISALSVAPGIATDRTEEQHSV